MLAINKFRKDLDMKWKIENGYTDGLVDTIKEKKLQNPDMLPGDLSLYITDDSLDEPKFTAQLDKLVEAFEWKQRIYDSGRVNSIAARLHDPYKEAIVAIEKLETEAPILTELENLQKLETALIKAEKDLKV